MGWRACRHSTWNASRGCEPDDALVGPRCRLEARRAGSVAPGRLWSWETTLSGTLNVTRNVKACWTGEAAFCSPYPRPTGLRCRQDVSYVVCLCFARVWFFCVYTLKKIIKKYWYNLLSHTYTASRRYSRGISDNAAVNILLLVHKIMLISQNNNTVCQVLNGWVLHGSLLHEL